MADERAVPITQTVTTTTTTTYAPGGDPGSGHTATQTAPGGRLTATGQGPGSVVFTPNDPTYPPYTLVFKGNGVPVQISGPHTDLLSIGEPNATVRIQLTHNETADGPNLSVLITRVGQ